MRHGVSVFVIHSTSSRAVGEPSEVHLLTLWAAKIRPVVVVSRASLTIRRTILQAICTERRTRLRDRPLRNRHRRRLRRVPRGRGTGRYGRSRRRKIPAAIAGVYTVIEAIVMRNLAIRIAIWASVGFLVSVGWGSYFANANKSIPIEPAVYTFAMLTQPAAALRLYLNPTSSFGLTWVVVANAATYALLGLIATTIRKHHRALHIPN
jgi:hypothetical protein